MAKMVNWPEFACRLTTTFCDGALPCAATLVALGVPKGTSGTTVPSIGRAVGVRPGRPGPTASIRIGVAEVELMFETLRLLPLKFLTSRAGWLVSAGASRSWPEPPELSESLPALAVVD